MAFILEAILTALQNVPENRHSKLLQILAREPQSYSEKREIVRSVSRHILDIRQQVGVDLLVHTK